MYINQDNNTELKRTIIDLYHIAPTALYNECNGKPSKYDRMIYVKKELLRTYPQTIEGLSPKTVWFTIQDVLN